MRSAPYLITIGALCTLILFAAQENCALKPFDQQLACYDQQEELGQ